MRPSACFSVLLWLCLCWLTICAHFGVQAASADRYPHLVAVFNSVFTPPEVSKQPGLPPGSPPMINEPISVRSSKCLIGCGNKIRLVNTASDAEHNSLLNNEIAINEDLLTKFDVANQLTALRIEYIKRQILKKLRMTEIPSVLVTDLPPQIAESNSVHNGYDYNEEADDFYGKTTKVIIFPYEDKARCARKIRSPSACVPFQLPNDIYPNDISSALLWFYKQPDEFDSHNQTFIISEVAHWDSNRSFQKTKPIAIQETNIKQGWLKIDVAYVVRSWLTHEESRTHAINLACKTCGLSISESPISFAPGFKPYLVIYTKHQAPKPAPVPPMPMSLQSLLPTHAYPQRRRKRSTICSPGATECCREHLYVSFAEIGWDNWIMEPAGYNAYFCKGTCSTAAAVTVSASQHNSIIQALMQQRNDKKATLELELTPCCAATQFQPLQLLYTDGNKTMTSKILPNMIVTQCGS